MKQKGPRSNAREGRCCTKLSTCCKPVDLRPREGPEGPLDFAKQQAASILGNADKVPLGAVAHPPADARPPRSQPGKRGSTVQLGHQLPAELLPRSRHERGPVFA